METLLNLDTELLLFLNSFHSEYFDWFFSMFTRREVWLPLYLSMAFVLFKGKGRAAWITLFFMLLIPSFADLLNQHLFKPYFDRLRPFHVEELKEQLHVFNENPRGRRSFMSAHAMNSFGLATFCLLLFKKRVFTLFIILWAVLNAYSRLYLGFHFPTDVLGGAGVGIFLGWGFFKLYHKTITRNDAFSVLKNATYNTAPIIITGLIITFCIFAGAYHNTILIEDFVRRFSKMKV